MPYIRRLVWDEWNVAHIARHGVTPEEVEQAFAGNPVVQQGGKGRSLAYGPARSGRMLTVVMDPVGDGEWYVVTARPASRREREIFARERGGSDQDD